MIDNKTTLRYLENVKEICRDNLQIYIKDIFISIFGVCYETVSEAIWGVRVVWWAGPHRFSDAIFK